ncbi:MAG: transposase [Selenomonadaceae bacterium]|nr:transposase [Selenomonadaceae bacterium]
MEATGHYWLPLYAHLRQAGQTVHVINPLQSDALRNMNDTIDALIVALRELCRQRFFVVDTPSASLPSNFLQITQRPKRCLPTF